MSSRFQLNGKKSLVLAFLLATLWAPYSYSFDVISKSDGSLLVRENKDAPFVPLTTNMLSKYLDEGKHVLDLCKALKCSSCHQVQFKSWIKNNQGLTVTHKLIEAYSSSNESSCINIVNPETDLISAEQKSISEALKMIPLDYSGIGPKCSVNFYMGMLNSGATIQEGNLDQSIWRAIENHTHNVPEVMSQIGKIKNPEMIDPIIQKNNTCSKTCHSSNLNSIYESFLAKSILDSEKQNGGKNIKKVYDKIFEKLNAKFGKLEIDTELNWVTNLINTYPSNQKHSRAHTEVWKRLQQRDDILIVMDFFMSGYGFQRPYMAPTTQLKNGIWLDGSLRDVQNDCYLGDINKSRGNKLPRLPSPINNQTGIVKNLDIPELAFNAADKAWEHSGRGVKLEKGSSDYIDNAKNLQIPLVCGVSGTTNILLWSLLSLGVELNPKELRLFLLTTWAYLCADGGHSLQEVLSAAKIIAKYIAKNDVTNHLPKTMLDSINAVTKDLSAVGPKSDKMFGSYYDGLFKDIEKDYPDFSVMRGAAQKNFNNYYKTLGCN
jgi:hypothetical protein